MPSNSIKTALIAAALFTVTLSHDLTIDQVNAIKYAEHLNVTADPDISKSFK
jgi:hypothetical protein